MDGPYFSYRQGSHKCNYSRPTFKSKRYRVWCWSNQNIIASQSACKKISSIHEVIQQILGYQILIATPIFDHTHPQISEITFSFSEFSPVCKKISSFHQFTLEIQSILESCDQTGHTYFDQLIIYVNLYQHGKNQAISLICSGDMAN